MQSLAVFFSYARADDLAENGRISELRKKLESELRVLSGDLWEVFQDTEDIDIGQPWQQRLGEGLAVSTFFVAILTPTYFKRPFCRGELEQFFAREKEMGRNDLIFPVLYLQTPMLTDADAIQADSLASMVAARQCDDWRQDRNFSLKSNRVKERITQLAEAILSAQQRKRDFKDAAIASLSLEMVIPLHTVPSLDAQSLAASAARSRLNSSSRTLSLETVSLPSGTYSKRRLTLSALAIIIGFLVAIGVAILRPPKSSFPTDEKSKPESFDKTTSSNLQSGRKPKSPGRTTTEELIASSDLDDRSAKVVGDLKSSAAELAIRLIEKANERRISIRIISGFRSSEEQAKFYEQGRTGPGMIVTNARQSVHNTGLAFDIGIFKNGVYHRNGPEYTLLGEIGEKLGLIWGGRETDPDLPHFETQDAQDVLKKLK